MHKINESFICQNCGVQVDPAPKTCRNHCPYCFSSLHVDGDVPGDRSTSCHGKMFPREYVLANGEIKIHFLCLSCGKQHWNKAAEDDEISQLDACIHRYRPPYE
ncbi:MAG: RNHCP domain-containing protein [Candidatus Peribacteria bacterium]|nr:MAG: RNHCP domain-containing protein [Candidatus Peribacteria bacterium]